METNSNLFLHSGWCDTSIQTWWIVGLYSYPETRQTKPATQQIHNQTTEVLISDSTPGKLVRSSQDLNQCIGHSQTDQWWPSGFFSWPTYSHSRSPHQLHNCGNTPADFFHQEQPNTARLNSNIWVKQVKSPLCLKTHLFPVIVHGLPTSLSVFHFCILFQYANRWH